MQLDLILGLSGGLLTASWGAFKDSPYEGFSLRSFCRSILVTAGFYFLFLFLLSKTDFSFHRLAVLFSAVALERLTQEYWKAFFRSKQRKGIYKIPQSFHVFGKVMTYKKRFPLGILLSVLTVVVLEILFGVSISGNSWIIPGVILSTLPSLGGAWKDAPIEGFEIKKFPRSFIIMFASIFLLSRLTNNLMILVLGAAGLERLLVEFYKTFLFLSTPGKFNSKVTFPEWKQKRILFMVSYTLGLVILFISLVL
jgi:hypothetical protein